MKCINVDFFIYSRSQDGHRADYISFMKNEFNCESFKFKNILSRKPIFFLMIEESFIFFLLISILRLFFFRKTLGLLFRLEPCVNAENFKLKLKRFLLNHLSKIEKIKIISIIPFHINPKYREICSDWIYDFQLWDIDLVNIKSDKNLVQKISRIETMKVAAIGYQDHFKGYDKFCNLSKNTNATFLSFGRVDQSMLTKAQELSLDGGIVINRYLSNDEVMTIYQQVDFIWCCYSPKYDQASGVFGRAVQFGCTPIIRKGSILEKFCKNEHISYISIDYSNDSRINIEAKNRSEHHKENQRRKDYSRNVLLKCLSL